MVLLQMGLPEPGLFEMLAVLLTLTAVCAYLNHRFLGLPTSIGVMLIALAMSLCLVVAGLVVPAIRDEAERLLESARFDETLLHGVLGFLLFAGALHIDLGDLRRHKFVVSTLATVGVVLSTALVGTGMWLLLPLFGLHVPLIHCLIFGALISPTDPIAVLAILKAMKAPRDLEVRIAGESLFNDGVGVVLFLALVGYASTPHGDHANHLRDAALLLVHEVGGGVLFGLLLGYTAYRLLKSVDQYQVEVLISLAMVAGGYGLAEALHVSAPIAMVVAGLLIGNHGRVFAMSETTRRHLDLFWELVDEILNAVLFVLIGLEVLVLTARGPSILAGAAAVGVVLAARWISVSVPLVMLRQRLPVYRRTAALLTWGGLRGGISVALALSLRGLLGGEQVETVELILVMTYMVVIFSIAVQGTSVGRLVRRWTPESMA